MAAAVVERGEELLSEADGIGGVGGHLNASPISLALARSVATRPAAGIADGAAAAVLPLRVRADGASPGGSFAPRGWARRVTLVLTATTRLCARMLDVLMWPPALGADGVGVIAAKLAAV
jgi:hypothetical protein